MRRKKEQPERPPKPRKRPGSFGWKLTFRQTLRMLGMLVMVDILLVALYAASLLAVTEQSVAGLIGEDGGEPLAQPSVLSPGALVTPENELPPGWWRMPDWEGVGVRQGLPRSLRLEEAEANYPWGWSRVVYAVHIPRPEGGYLRADFDLTGSLLRFWVSGIIIGGAEFIMLFLGFLGTRLSVKKTLAPIEQLARTTSTIAADPVRPRVRDRDKRREELPLSGTIHTLNTITAKRLDTRIAIDDERQELRGLAGAINGMLDRLDAAYQSQLRFVSDASHELRTPIAVIQGYANLLDRWGKDDPAALAESIEAIKSEAAGMQELVEQLLFLARSDNNSITLEMETQDMSLLAGEVLRETRLIDQSHPYFSDIAPGLLVLGDGGLLKQALRIFVDNAIKYTPAGGNIKVSAGADGQWVRVSVSDDGIGIPEEDIPRVFDRFFRSDESRARKTGGTGLGLSIAKWTVQRHGGHVEVISRKDVGTRVTMVLPVVQPQSAAPYAQSC